MRTYATSSLVLLLVLAVPTTHLPGQTIAGAADTPAISDARLLSAIARLQPRVGVRASSAGVLTEGQFARTQRDTLWLSTPKAVMIGVPVRNLDSLWTRERSVGKGALIGTAVGAAAVSGLFLALVNGLCDSASGCGDDYPLAIAYGVGIGGSGGAVVGAGIGALVRHWQRRHP